MYLIRQSAAEGGRRADALRHTDRRRCCWRRLRSPVSAAPPGPAATPGTRTPSDGGAPPCTGGQGNTRVRLHTDTPSSPRFSPWDIPTAPQIPKGLSQSKMLKALNTRPRSHTRTRTRTHTQITRTLHTGIHTHRHRSPAFQCIEESDAIRRATDLNDVLPGQFKQVCPCHICTYTNQS